MSNETEQGGGSEGSKATASRPWKLALGFAGVAVLAATGGFVVANSTNSPASPESTGEATRSANAAVVSVDAPYGEARGFDGVIQEESIVDADWLEANLDNPDVVIIEVSENRSTSTLTPYAVGHIPNAVELVWYRDFVELYTRDLVGPERFTEVAQAAGVNSDSTIVLYGDSNNWFAAYAAWVFKLYGAEDVRLLDGARNLWEAEGRALTATVPTPTAGDFTAQTPNSDLRAFQPEVLAIVDGVEEGQLIDIRGPAEYNGEIGVAEGFGGEAAAKWGHIPGAANVPWGSVVNEDGTFKSEDEIRKIYAEAGIDGTEPIIVYCRIGERASHTWFALTQILGYEVKVYDGSYTEWGNSVGVPIVNPALEASGGFVGLWGG